MDTSIIRQQLHRYIDEADDQKIEAIYTILNAGNAPGSSYTDEELKLFYSRRDNYLKGNSTTYTAEETHKYIREQRKKP